MKKKSGRLLRVMRGSLIIFSILLLAGAGTFGVLWWNGRKNLLEGRPIIQETGAAFKGEGHQTGKEEEEFLAEGEISYFGKKYRYKNDLINILCMGVDRLALIQSEAVYGEGGQADAIVLLSLHARSGAITLLHISRETLAEIELYTETGRYAGMESRQLCLAYSYGDGREKSCENVGRAVSRLLYGIPIQAYLAVDMSVIQTLNDAIGGVEVVLAEDSGKFLADGTPGESYLLMGDAAYDYVHYRDYKGEDAPVDSNAQRMARQKQYLESFIQKALEQSRRDLSLPLRLFGQITEDTVTSLTPSDISYLASLAVKRENKTIRMESVPGETVLGDDGYARYLVDDEKLFPLILELFYEAE